MSNSSALEMTPERLGWLVPTDAELPLAHIKAIYYKQGYVWLKGFFERRAILAFRRDFFAALHKRKIIRYTLPGERNCTGGHYDLIYLRAGTDRLYSSWIPIGDIPVEMGGLIYLEGSDALGRRMEAQFSARNADLSPQERISAYNHNMRAGGWISVDLADMARRFNSRWLVADYEAGDMVIHSPYMVHAATVNNDPHGRIRLSTDIRYQAKSDDIDKRWAHDWAPDDHL